MDKKGFPILLMTLLITAVLLSPAFSAEPEKTRETFRGNAIVKGSIATGSASMVQITITKWTTPEQRQNLLAALFEKGQEALVKELNKQEETGFIRLPNTLGYRLRYAWQIPGENGRRIVLATDRPIAFGELWHSTRTLDYTITMIELRLDQENKGDGTIALAVKLKPNIETKTLELENFDTAPLQVTRLQKTE